jgi:hypothetical protein
LFNGKTVTMKKLLFVGLITVAACIAACHGNVNNATGTADSSSKTGADSTPADATKSTNSTSSSSSSIRGSSDTTHIKPAVKKQAKVSLPAK